MSTDRDKYEDYWSATSPQVVSKKRQLLASEQSLFHNCGGSVRLPELWTATHDQETNQNNDDDNRRNGHPVEFHRGSTFA